jgi:hypothetical protein
MGRLCRDRHAVAEQQVSFDLREGTRNTERASLPKFPSTAQQHSVDSADLNARPNAEEQSHRSRSGQPVPASIPPASVTRSAGQPGDAGRCTE